MQTVVAAKGPALGTGTPRRWPRFLPLVILAATEVVVGLAVFKLAATGLSLGQLLLSYGITNAWLGASFAPFGAYVAYKRPEVTIGWLFAAFGVLYGVSAYGIAMMTRVLLGGREAHLSVGVVLVSNTWTIAVAVCFPLILLLFPDGRLATPSWRWLVALFLADGVIWMATWTLKETAPLDRIGPSWANFISRTETVTNFGLLAVFIICVVALTHRWRRSAGRVHDQLLWLLAGSIIAVGLFLPTAWGVTSYWATSMLVGVPLFCVACTIALVRYRLFDIDLVVNRSLVYLALSGGLLAIYLGVVELARATVGRGAQLGGSLVAAALVAAVFVPCRAIVQRLVDRFMFGTRGDAAQTLSTLTASLESSVDDELSTALQALRQSLRLPHLAVVVEERVIGTIDPGSAPEAFPLRYRSQPVGDLLVWARRGQRQLDSSDRAALRVVAGPLASAVHSVQLNDQLQESREELLAARDLERRRLHRDLHDGLGPALTAVALKADAAGNIVANDPGRARELLDQIGSEARAAVGDVRRIAHGLRPPTLDKYGLLAAVSFEATRFTSRLDGHPLVVSVDLPTSLPPLADDVVVTAYRITTEALTNVARHSNASSARVMIRVDETLRLEIADDGTSSSTSWPGGFGTDSMAKRAADCGGSLSAGPTPDGGRVVATFPVAQVGANA